MIDLQIDGAAGIALTEIDVDETSARLPDGVLAGRVLGLGGSGAAARG